MDWLMELLKSVEVYPTEQDVAGWNYQQREEARKWASKYYLHTHGHDVEVPSKPDFLEKKET